MGGKNTFMHLEMGAQFLVCAKRFGTIPMITSVWLCPGWGMFASHVGT
jgi:hypothetical protein